MSTQSQAEFLCRKTSPFYMAILCETPRFNKSILNFQVIYKKFPVSLYVFTHSGIPPVIK